MSQRPVPWWEVPGASIRLPIPDEQKHSPHPLDAPRGWHERAHLRFAMATTGGPS